MHIGTAVHVRHHNVGLESRVLENAMKKKAEGKTGAAKMMAQKILDHLFGQAQAIKSQEIAVEFDDLADVLIRDLGKRPQNFNQQFAVGGRGLDAKVLRKPAYGIGVVAGIQQDLIHETAR
ncbi:MAG: hypothetical protein BWY83_03328 [bacterium ADurb.Bin478]|nr:MAG: hypothetical protein BWY83_03328 [bacterium ADurb.Bin478]